MSFQPLDGKIELFCGFGTSSLAFWALCCTFCSIFHNQLYYSLNQCSLLSHTINFVHDFIFSIPLFSGLLSLISNVRTFCDDYLTYFCDFLRRWLLLRTLFYVADLLHHTSCDGLSSIPSLWIWWLFYVVMCRCLHSTFSQSGRIRCRIIRMFLDSMRSCAFPHFCSRQLECYDVSRVCS